MKINSKKQSSSIIKKLNLNRVPEIVCEIFEQDVIENFCDKILQKLIS